MKHKKRSAWESLMRAEANVWLTALIVLLFIGAAVSLSYASKVNFQSVSASTSIYSK